MKLQQVMQKLGASGCKLTNINFKNIFIFINKNSYYSSKDFLKCIIQKFIEYFYILKLKEKSAYKLQNEIRRTYHGEKMFRLWANVWKTI